jgi:hypothetical protein
MKFVRVLESTLYIKLYRNPLNSFRDETRGRTGTTAPLCVNFMHLWRIYFSELEKVKVVVNYAQKRLIKL